MQQQSKADLREVFNPDPEEVEEMSKIMKSISADRLSQLSQSKSKRSIPPEYDPNMAIQLERLEQKSFKKSFFETME